MSSAKNSPVPTSSKTSSARYKPKSLKSLSFEQFNRNLLMIVALVVTFRFYHLNILDCGLVVLLRLSDVDGESSLKNL